MDTVKRKPPGKALLGFKVILRRGGRFWSAVFELLFTPTCYRVRYELGRWARPHEGCGPLCVFDTLETARRFRKNCGYARYGPIFRCLYVPSRAKRVYFPGIWLDLRSRELRHLPSGTRLAKAVKLVEKVK